MSSRSLSTDDDGVGGGNGVSKIAAFGNFDGTTPERRSRYHNGGLSYFASIIYRHIFASNFVIKYSKWPVLTDYSVRKWR